ncbi:MAG: hypothetical protein GX984_03605 [Erysipelothrix sp.]|nr:hypothetical protein [Erysipelothrix sp.]
MVSKSVFIELAISIFLLIAYFVYFIVKYKNKPGFLSAILWGIGGFFIANAVSNVINMGFIALVGESRFQNMLETQPYLTLLLTTIALAMGAVFAAYFVIRTQKNKGKFEEGYTDEATGFMTGSGLLASPFNQVAYLMVFVQSFVNAIVINKNPSIEELGDAVTPESFEEIKLFYASIKPFDFLSIAVMALVLSFSYVILFKYVSRKFDDDRWYIKFALPIVVMVGFVFVVRSISVLEISSLIKTILTALIGAGLVYFNQTFDPDVEIIEP